MKSMKRLLAFALPALAWAGCCQQEVPPSIGHHQALRHILILDATGTMLGILTERDLVTRVVAKALDPRTTPVSEVMTRNPRTIEPQSLAAEAVNLMEQHRITALLVVDAQGRLVGALNIHDLLRAGVV